MTEQLSLRQRATLVEALSSSLEHGGTALHTVPKAVARILEGEGAWREFTTSRGEHVTYDRFADFVATPPLKGLGASQELLYRVCPELTSELDKAFGRKRRSDKTTDNVDNVNDSSDLERPTGNAHRQALRRLRKDAPELHADVLAGRLSAHGAMVKAGFRPKTVTIPVTRPEAVAKSLLKYMSADDIAKLIAMLVGAADLSDNQGDGTP